MVSNLFQRLIHNEIIIRNQVGYNYIGLLIGVNSMDHTEVGLFIVGSAVVNTRLSKSWVNIIVVKAVTGLFGLSWR